MLNYSDIQKIYTDKINSFIQKGFMINLQSMSGTQGEISKVDLTNGQGVYSIILSTITDTHDHDWYDCYLLQVRYYSKSEKVLWLNEGGLVSEDKFYVINRNPYTRPSKLRFTTSFEEIKEIHQKQYSRYTNNNTYTSIKFKGSPKQLKKMLNNIPGFKSVTLKTLSDAFIEKVYSSIDGTFIQYQITINGKTAILATNKGGNK